MLLLFCWTWVIAGNTFLRDLWFESRSSLLARPLARMKFDLSYFSDVRYFILQKDHIYMLRTVDPPIVPKTVYLIYLTASAGLETDMACRGDTNISLISLHKVESYETVPYVRDISCSFGKRKY